MEVSVQLHALVALPLGREPPVPTGTDDKVWDAYKIWRKLKELKVKLKKFLYNDSE
jgi:hypothetical protein